VIRVVLALIRCVSLVVPRRDRDAWRREWEAEILHEQAALDPESPGSVGAQVAVGRRALGSIADAAWLRRQFTADSDLVHDVRYAARLVRRQPAFALLAASILAVGIGSTTAVWTMVDRLVLRALPYPDAHELVSFLQRNHATGNMREEVAPGNFLDWRAQSTSFENIAAAEPYSVDYTGGERPEVLLATNVTEGFFDLLAVRPHLGRFFDAADHAAGDNRLAVISHRFWLRLGGDHGIVGTALRLDDAPFTIVGVLPERADLNLFDGRGERDVWLPKAIMDADRQVRGPGWWAAIGRLRDGVSREVAQAEMDAISARLGQAEPRTNARTTVGVEPLETHLMRTVRPALWVMLGAVVLVLGIVCANVANLLLVRATARQRELTVRSALGAGRLRLMRQLLSEGALLAAAGTTLGVALAWWSLRAIARLSPVQSAHLDNLTLDLPMLGIAAVVGAATTLAFGLLPAAQLSRRVRLEADGRGATANARARSLRDALAVAEVAVAVVLAVVTGLLLRSFTQLVRVDPGFRAERLAVAQVFAWDRHNTPDELRAFVDAAVGELGRVPGVVEVGGASAMPLIEANINIESPFTIEGRPAGSRGETPTTFLTVATPGYFPVMGIPVVAGRSLSETDDARGAPVAVITRTLADKYWPDGGAVGAWVQFRFRGQVQRREVVGVVGELRHDALELPPRDELFVPFAQAPFGSMTFVMKTAGDPSAVVEPAKQAIWRVDPLQTIYDAGTGTDLLAGAVGPRRFALVLTSAYGLVALGLAALGVYAVMSASTRQRSREIGVRLALGATHSEITRLIVRRGLLLGLTGVAIGLAGSVGAALLLRGELYAVEPIDPITLGGVATLLLATTAVACLAPARRATRVDPLVVLKN